MFDDDATCCYCGQTAYYRTVFTDGEMNTCKKEMCECPSNIQTRLQYFQTYGKLIKCSKTIILQEPIPRSEYATDEMIESYINWELTEEIAERVYIAVCCSDDVLYLCDTEPE